MGDPGKTSTRKQEVHVLISGAGPFRENLYNPANMIVSAMGTHIPPRSNAVSVLPKLDIHLYPTPVPWKVSYSWVRENIPPMLFPQSKPMQLADHNLLQQPLSNSKPNYDIVLFVGMAGGRKYYSLETQAHRDGYELPDVDGKGPSDTDSWSRFGAPETLPTSFDTKEIHHHWRENVPDDTDVQLSEDAGHYLCDYIFYTGLCEYWLHGDKNLKNDRPVVFLHVPGETDPDSIQRGVIVATELIRAMAYQWVERHDG